MRTGRRPTPTAGEGKSGSAPRKLGTLTLNVGATIDVGTDQANAGVSGPMFGGQVTFSTSRTATNDGINLTINGGSFADFLNGIKGESAWDGVVIVGNQVYSYNDTTLYLTPNTTIAASNGVETAAVSTYINDANNFMNNQAGMWSALGADGSSGVVLTNSPNAVFNGFSTNLVLVNIRPGVVVKNSGHHHRSRRCHQSGRHRPVGLGLCRSGRLELSDHCGFAQRQHHHRVKRDRCLSELHSPAGSRSSAGRHYFVCR